MSAPGLNPFRAKDLLPNEPRIRNAPLQQALTEKYLLPELHELERFLLTVRLQLDSELHQAKPVKLGKPYPLGQCLEIALSVERKLREIKETSLPLHAHAGFRAFRAFLRSGGEFRLIWGDLRRQYFQNAFQLGTLYVDVANDTVVPSKPKVEILPFHQADMVPVEDFLHFATLAGRYWHDRVYPNHVLPSLAPYCPLIHVGKSGRVKIHDSSRYMLALTRTAAFVPSEQVLTKASMPQELFDWMRTALQKTPLTLPSSPKEGRQLALQRCEDYRHKRWHQNPATEQKITETVSKLNRRLARQAHFQQKKDTAMSSIRIDNIEYDLNTLSAEANAQLQSVQFVDQELARLQAQIAALQTARHAYVNALKAALPEPENH